MQGVGVLLEGGGLAALEAPDVGDLGVLLASGGFVGAGVAAEGDDGVAGVEDLVDVDAEAVPLGGASGEDAVDDGLGSDVGVPSA